VLSDITVDVEKTGIYTENYLNILQVVGNQRVSVSGVDEDEEAMNMIKYENAYTLSSKMIQTLTEVYDRLILQTGV